MTNPEKVGIFVAIAGHKKNTGHDLYPVFVSLLREFDEYKKLAEKRNEALKTIHGIASETFESHNQLELIRLTASENTE